MQSINDNLELKSFLQPLKIHIFCQVSFIFIFCVKGCLQNITGSLSVQYLYFSAVTNYKSIQPNTTFVQLNLIVVHSVKVKYIWACRAGKLRGTIKNEYLHPVWLSWHEMVMVSAQMILELRRYAGSLLIVGSVQMFMFLGNHTV